MPDREIIPLLHGLPRPTFFTRDEHFYERHLCHARYCLVYLAVAKAEVATFVRKLLRHRQFNTAAKRMGTVIRVSPVGFALWRLHGANRSALLGLSQQPNNGVFGARSERSVK
jgi:hypothetical protein